jgi:hypothetical protein
MICGNQHPPFFKKSMICGNQHPPFFKKQACFAADQSFLKKQHDLWQTTSFF